MLNQLLFSTFLGFLTSSFSGLWAQESIHVSGGEASGTGGITSYSVGQVLYSNINNDHGHVSLGVQQPYEVLIVGNMEPEQGTAIRVYPNPAKTDIIIAVQESSGDEGVHTYSIALYDMYGKMLLKQQLVAVTAGIPIDHLVDAMYILKVSCDHTPLRTFKVIKTH